MIRGRLLNLPEVRTAVMTVDAGRQHQAVQLHHAANALAVVARSEDTVHHSPHAAVAIRRSTVGDRADLLNDRIVRRGAAQGGVPPSDRSNWVSRPGISLALETSAVAVISSARRMLPR